MPLYVFGAIAIYLVFLIIGLLHSHTNASIDIKYQFYAFIFYLFLVNAKDLNILRLLFIINALVAGVYILVYLGIMPSLWYEASTGVGGRVYGPPIIAIMLISFYYLYNRRAFDAPLAISWVLALVYLFLTSNLMNLVTSGLLLILIVINIRKIFNPLFLFGFAIVIVAAVGFLNTDLAPKAIKEKLPYVLKPWEYESLKIRIEDFEKALGTEDFNGFEKIIGKGFGASTTIYRENEIVQSFSRHFTFREIDNGFYYVYHRGGWLLLILFFLVHAYLVFKTPNNKARLGLLIIMLFTNLLSIHYFTYVFYLIVPFLILETESRRTLQLPKKESDEE